MDQLLAESAALEASMEAKAQASLSSPLRLSQYSGPSRAEAALPAPRQPACLPAPACCCHAALMQPRADCRLRPPHVPAWPARPHGLQEWGQAWQAVQSELETLHEPPPLPAAAAGSLEQPPSWVGPLVAAWTYLADSLQQQARGQHTLADWLASRVLPLSTLRLAWSAWLARLLPTAEQ